MEILQFTPNKNKKIKKIAIIIFLSLIIIAGIIIASLYITDENFREKFDIYILKKEITEDNSAQIVLNSGETQHICAYDKYIGVLSKSTLMLYNNSGEEVSKLNTMISNPIFEKNNKYLCLAEKNGQKIYLINDTNIVWEKEVEGKITDVNVNKNGYVSVIVTGTSYKTVVITIDEKGKEIFKTYLASTSVITTDISTDNKYLAIAEIDSSSAIIQSNIKIISIEKAKTDPTNSIIYTHKAENNELIVDIKYQDKEKLICLYDNSVHLIEDKNDTELLKIDSKSDFIDLNLKNYVIQTIETTEFFKSNIQLLITNVNSKNENLYLTKGVLKSVTVSDNIIALNFSTEVHFVNNNGWLIKKYVSSQGITDIVVGNSIAGIVYRNKIEIINL